MKVLLGLAALAVAEVCSLGCPADHREVDGGSELVIPFDGASALEPEVLERLVSKAQKMPIERSVEFFTEIVERDARHYSKFEHTNAELLFCELARLGRLDILERMERRLSRRKRLLLFRYLAWRCRKEARPLLERWAIENPHLVGLMEFHPRAFELLVACIHNLLADGTTRAMCISKLARIAGERRKEALAVIKLYENDKSPVIRQSANIINETVGMSARNAIGQLEKEEPKDPADTGD